MWLVGRRGDTAGELAQWRGFRVSKHHSPDILAFVGKDACGLDFESPFRA